MSQNEYTLLAEAVNYDEYGSVTLGARKLFDEVHENRVPRMGRNRELLYCSVGLMSRSLGALTRSARATIVLDKGAEVWPGELPSDEGEGLVDAIMSSEQVIVPVTEDTESEIGVVGDVDAIIEEE